MAKDLGAQTVLIRRANATATNAPTIEARRAKGDGTPDEVVADDDLLLEIDVKGYNGTGYDSAAVIKFEIDGTPGASSDMPGRMVFLTTPDASATPVERMRIDNAGGVLVKNHLDFDEQSTPGDPGAAKGRIYVKNTVPSTLVFIDDTNAELTLGAGEFGDGGEAGGAGRTLGNTDAFALGFETNNVERIHITSDGDVGVGLTAPEATIHTLSDRRSSLSSAETNFHHESIFQANPITSWTTVRTVSPSTVTSVWMHGFIEMRAMGHTDLIDNGARFSRWYYRIANAAPTVAVVGTDATSGGAIPQLRLNVSGNNIQVQVQSSNGSNNFYGTVFVDIYAPWGQVTQPDWTIS